MIDITSAGWQAALFQAGSLAEFMRQRQDGEDFRWARPTSRAPTRSTASVPGVAAEDPGDPSPAPQPPAETIARLATSLDALAALAAHLRIESEGLDVDPAISESLAGIARLVVGDTRALPDGRAGAIIAVARTCVHQAADLIEHPDRAPGWTSDHEGLLQGIGQLSAGVVDAFSTAAESRPALGDLLATPGATFVDVGTGTGWLAIAVARTFPALRVVGIDIFEPALDLARANVAASGLGDRIELGLQDAATLEPEVADAVWLPMLFLPAAVLPDVVERATAALRPGGWLLPGTFPGPGDTLPERLVALRTLRCGGHPWTADEIDGLLRGAGLVDTGEIPLNWRTPMRLYAGQKPAPTRREPSPQ
jgi:SAM-dependent methyltransferase